VPHNEVWRAAGARDHQVSASHSSAAASPVFDRQWRILLGLLVALDALAVWTSLTLAYDLRMSTGILGPYEAHYDPDQYRTFAVISVPLWLVIFLLVGLYKRDNLLGGLIEYQQIVWACTTGVVAIIVLSFFWRDFSHFSRGWLAAAWFLACSLVTAERFLVRRCAYFGRRRGWLTSRVLIVGANDQGVAMAAQWLTSPTSGMQVIGFLDDFKPLGLSVINGLRVLGRPTALEQIARRTDAQEVIVVPTAVAWETFEKLVATAGRAPYVMRFSPGFYEVLTTGVAVTNKTFVPLFTVNDTRLVGIEATFKAAFDYGLGFVAFFYTLPLYGLIASGLKVGQPQMPVLVHLPTVGVHGTIFSMYKFRSLPKSANASLPAPSRLEYLLYCTGLDKLPQLLNVLRGEMSLVGPRPRIIDDGAVDPRSLRNLQTVKPGITGAWASLKTRQVSEADEIANELRYVRNWTLSLDVQILFQSVRAWIYSGFWPGRVRDARKKAITLDF
jgi:lipopolysaccharide/colanic/teichoic acid biosynthesis glycosyltransferase